MTETSDTTPPDPKPGPEPGPGPGPGPERTKVKCEKCGASVDVEEITTARGKFYCPDCVDGTIALESVLPFREKYDIPAIRRTVLGCGIVLVASVFGSLALLIYTYMKLDTQMDCRNMNLRLLHNAMAAYAREYNAYPPEDNDLRPLYDTGHVSRLGLFVCPGTQNQVTEPAHLKDDRTSPEGAGMSYLYRGGYGFAVEEGDEKLPLVWDQSVENHKGRGANVIFKDGHHEWVEHLPALQTPAQEESAQEGRNPPH